MKILMINGSPHPRGGDVPGRQLRPDAGLRPTSPRGGHPVGLQEIHEHEAFGGGSVRRLYCRLTSFSRSLQINLCINLDGTELQVRRAKAPTISDRCLGFSLNIAWQNLNGRVTCWCAGC